MVVAAAKTSLGIGKNNDMPWNLPSELRNFKKLTSATAESSNRNAVIMGRKTWESIPEKFRPLSGRLNVVLTRNQSNLDVPKDVVLASGLDEAIDKVNEMGPQIEKMFVIGGGSIYSQVINDSRCNRIYLTEVNTDVECDTFFPNFRELGFECFSTSEPRQENGVSFQYQVWERKTEPEKSPSMARDSSETVHEEMQYLNMIKKIIETGVRRTDRTGTGTLSLFGVQMRYSLRENILPLLTTKRVFWRGVAEELLWFISGDTSAKTLQDKNIRIWDGNGSREYLNSLGLHDRETGDLGPVYGFQWRHFGAKYTNMHADYTGKGVDQLAEVVEKIKNNPSDRRIILSAWNPADLNLMALPPCHMFAQFYVANGELSCQMYQRSADMGLGVPFNIASYSLLTRMLAQVTGLKAGEFVHTIGDAHVYLDHVEPLKEQLRREPRPFPVLKINPAVKDIDSFSYDDFTVEDYVPHKTIKMKMSV